MLALCVLITYSGGWNLWVQRAFASAGAFFAYPRLVAVLYGVDGEPLIEVHERAVVPFGFCR